MRVLFLILFCFLGILNLVSQNNTSVQVVFKFGNDTLELNKFYAYNQDSIQFQTIKMYLSNIQVYNKKQLIFKEDKSYHLIDISQNHTAKILLPKLAVNKKGTLKFNLGIDSITNISGALSGDLDPTKGMYWSWQSGYINFKIEGVVASSTINKHFFEYHIGGYNGLNNAIQPIELNASTTKPFIIVVDLENFCLQLDIANQKNIMSPSAQAVTISRILANCFSLR